MIKRQKDIPSLDFHGLRIFDYTAGASGLSSSFAYIEVPAGISHADARSRRSDKYYFITRGSIVFHLDGTRHEFGEGDFCLVRKGQVFAYTNTTGDDAALILVHTPSFDPESEVFVERE